MNLDPHKSLVIIMTILVCAYVLTGLVVMRNDRRFNRTMNDMVYYMPVFAYIMLFVVLLFWPAKNILAAFVWNVKQYMENA